MIPTIPVPRRPRNEEDEDQAVPGTSGGRSKAIPLSLLDGGLVGGPVGAVVVSSPRRAVPIPLLSSRGIRARVRVRV